MRKLFKFSLHTRKLNAETIWDFQDFKNSKKNSFCRNYSRKYRMPFRIFVVTNLMNICHSEYHLYTSQYPKDKKIDSQWCPYLRVMIKFSNLCVITLPCWNSSGKRKRALEAFHSWLLDFPRKARRENTSCSKYLFDGLTSDCCRYKPSSSKTREPLTCHCLLSLGRTF